MAHLIDTKLHYLNHSFEKNKQKHSKISEFVPRQKLGWNENDALEWILHQVKNILWSFIFSCSLMEHLYLNIYEGGRPTIGNAKFGVAFWWVSIWA